MIYNLFEIDDIHGGAVMRYSLKADDIQSL